MAPDEVRRLRQALGLGRAQFATLLGVSVSTVCRWEAPGAHGRLDPLQADLLGAVAVLATQPEDLARVAEDVREGLLLHGTLGGLHRLLRALYGPCGPRLPSRVRGLSRCKTASDGMYCLPHR